MVTLGLLACIATLQNVVSMECRATPLSRLVPELQKLAGQRIEVAANLQEEVLLIRAKNVSAAELLQQVAKSCFAEFRKRADGTLVLARDEPAFRKAAQARASTVGAKVREQVARYVEANLATKSFDQPEARKLLNQIADAQKGDYSVVRNLELRAPLQQLALKLAKEVDFEVLAAMDYGKSMTYAYPANSWQRKLSPAAVQAIERAGQDLRLFHEEKANSGNPAVSHDAIPALQVVPARTLLEVRLTGDWLLVFVRMYNKDFQQLGFPLLTVPLAKPVSPKTEGQTKSKVTFSPESRLLIARNREITKSDQLSPLSDGLKAILLDPAKSEPLGLLASDLVLATIPEGTNVVANLPDTMLGLHGWDQDDVSVDLAEESVMGHTERHSELGWVRINGYPSFGEGALRVGRKVIQDLARGIDAQKRAPLEPLANLAAQSAWFSGNSFAQRLCQLQGRRSGSIARMNWRVLQWYGRIPLSERLRLAKGVTVSQMRAVDQEALVESLTTSNWGSETTVNASSQNLTQFQVSNPSELVDLGLLPSATFRLSTREAKAYFLSSGEKLSQAMDPVTPLMVAMRNYEMERGTQWALDAGPYRDFRPGIARSVTFEFVPSRRIIFREQLLDDQVEDRLLTYAQLDKAFRDEVDKHLVAMRKRDGGGG